MEKLIYVFWRKQGEAPEPVRELVLSELGPRLLEAGVERLQLDIADLGDVTDAQPQFRLAATRPAPDGLISFWVSSAYRRAPAEALLAPHFARVAGYVVSESTVLPGVEHAVATGTRSFGFAQITFLRVPPRMPHAQWRKIWFEQHTPVGIELQANYRYVQNVVVQQLAEDAPPFSGIVQESFPHAALRDAQAFYDAVGDEPKCRARVARMMESSSRFIDFDKLDVVPMSEYQLQRAAEPAL